MILQRKKSSIYRRKNWWEENRFQFYFGQFYLVSKRRSDSADDCKNIDVL
jgi:hypothetical protein